MKHVLILLFIVLGFAFAADDEGCIYQLSENQQSVGSDDITLTFLQDWQITWAGQALGIDCWDDGSSTYVIFSNATDDMLGSLDPTTGATGPVSCTLDPANDTCFGVAYDDEATTPLWVTSDWGVSDNFCSYDLISWFTETDPYGTTGRGMAHDGTDFWIASYNGNVYRYQPGGSTTEYSTPEVGSGQSGLAAFPYGGDILVVLTCYQNLNLFFYNFDGSTLSYLGSAACPVSTYRSYGLAYSENRGTIFWSYAPASGDYRIAELSFLLTALERTTWGELKAVFE